MGLGDILGHVARCIINGAIDQANQANNAKMRASGMSDSELRNVLKSNSLGNGKFKGGWDTAAAAHTLLERRHKND